MKRGMMNWILLDSHTLSSSLCEADDELIKADACMRRPNPAVWVKAKGVRKYGRVQVD